MANEKLLAMQYRHDVLKLIASLTYWETRLKTMTPQHLASSTEEDLAAHIAAAKESAKTIFGHVDWEKGYLMPDGEGPMAPTHRQTGLCSIFCDEHNH